TAQTIAAPTSHIPLWLKLVYTAFMAVLIPVNWDYYGPTNFLFFFAASLFLTLVRVWLASPPLVSLCAAGIPAPQTLWVLDFLFNAVGLPFTTGLTDYMFKSRPELFLNGLHLRGLSLFHGWLPFLLVYLVWRLGYDGRALPAWTVLAWVLILICFFFMPPPRPDAGLQPVNIDYVYGFSDIEAQQWMPAGWWVVGLMILMPLLLFIPTHLLLR